jgi:streptogramin lyase
MRSAGRLVWLALGVLAVGLPSAAGAQLAIVEFPVANRPAGIAPGPDGNVWFTEPAANQVGHITPAGVVTEFAVLTAASEPTGIAAGADGNLWFTQGAASRIGRITPTGAVTEFPLPAAGSSPRGITAGPDGNLWFTERDGNRIGRITVAGAITEFALPAPGSQPTAITAGPDGALWFTQASRAVIGRITAAGDITEFPISDTAGGITSGPDGNLWFTISVPNHRRVARMTVGGQVTEFPATFPVAITAGPDDHLWYLSGDTLNFNVSGVGRMAPAGSAVEFGTPTFAGDPRGITTGPDGNVWFTEFEGSRIGRITLPFALLTVNWIGPGSVACDPPGVTCGALPFTPGTVVTLTAYPALGARFAGWSGGGCSGTGTTCVVTMATDLTVTATFVQQYGLTVTRTGTGSGSVVSEPPGIDCPTICFALYDAGTAVTLTAAAAAGSAFAGWSGGGCSGVAPCTVAMTTARQVFATFVPVGPGPFGLTVSKAGSAGGTVTSTPPGFICAAACAAFELPLAGGAIVTLAAASDPDAAFLGWSGGGCSGTAPCTLVLLDDTTVTARFRALRPLVSGPGPGGGPQVRMFDATGAPAVSFLAYPPGFTGGVFVARGNVDGAGAAEIVTGAGAGGAPHVGVWNADGSDPGWSFLAYDPAFRGGVRVASCDVMGSGSADVVTAPGPGGGPHVRVFGVAGGAVVERAGFFAYDPGFGNGLWVACGDVTGDGVAEVVTGADAGGGAHVRVFGLAGGTPVELASFFAYPPGFTGGVRVAAADIDGDGRADVVTGPGPGGSPLVHVWSLAGGPPAARLSFFAYPAGFAGGVFVAAGQVDGLGAADIVTGAGAGGASHVRVITAGLAEVAGFLAYDPGFLGGVAVAAGP